MVADALKTHGMILADSGGVDAVLMVGLEKSTQFTDATGRNLEAELGSLSNFVHARDFEVVDASGLMVAADSFEVRGP